VVVCQVVLAFSSGVLFHESLLEGTLVSVTCSSLASLLMFLVSRYVIFKDTAAKEIAKRPLLKAIYRACSKDGFKTVFTLRLSPLLPLPVAGYNYLYGASSVSVFDFLAGITLGSIKPYFLDCYLGLFGKSVIDEAIRSRQVIDPLSSEVDVSQNDIVLLSVVALVLVVGSFATQVAANTWTEIKTEMDTLRAASQLSSAVVDEDISKSIEIPEWEENNVDSKGEKNMSILDMLAIEESELPSFLRSINDQIKRSSSKLKKAIRDEWKLVLAQNSDSRSDSSESTVVIEPINKGRKLFEYEKVPLIPETVKEYTVESILFTFVLISMIAEFSNEST